MSVEWTAESKTIETYEGSTISETFSCITDVESGHKVEIIFLSTTLPSTIYTEVIGDDNSISGLRLYGDVPSIINQETYRLVARLQEYHTIGGSKIIDLFSDIGLTIINHSLEPQWDDGFTLPTGYVKSAYSAELSTGIINPNGNEVFRKSSGALPPSLTLYPNGVLSGIPLSNEMTYDDTTEPPVRLKDPYSFGVTVYRNNEIVLEEKTFTFDIYPENYGVPPTWITESGIIGSASAGDNVLLKVIATINFQEEFPPSDRTITYKIIEGDLPPGLNLESVSSQGIISGIVVTNQVKHFEFKICAYRQYNGVWYPEDPNGAITEKSFEAARDFYIITNQPEPEHEIIWGEDGETINGGSFSIGTVINDALPAAVSVDGSPVTYTVIDYGTLPSFINILENGDITGTATPPIETYYCYVRASTQYTYVNRKVEFNITKGLGNNSLNLSLRINLEYKDQFNEIRDQLNSSAYYGTDQEGYNIDVFPKIDIATLTCFDREILAGIFNYGNLEVVRFLETRFKTYTDEDVNGDSTATYEAYYKAIDESTYQWDPIDNGNFDFEAQMKKEKSLTSAYDGNTYETPPFYPMESDAKLDFNNEYYNSNVNQKQWILDRETPEGKKLYKLSNVHITTNPFGSYKVFNFKNVRDALQKKIYVYKKTGDYYFDLGNQQLFEKTNITIKKLYEETIKDEEQKEIIEYHICNMDETEDTIVEYKFGKVYLNDGLIMDTLFLPQFDTHQFMVSSENEEIYRLEEISDPWCLDLNNSENKWLSMDKIPAGKEMVLPRISDDDVSEDGKYIQMLNPVIEPLPKWKRKEAKYWEAETIYDINDMIYYDSKYYLVLKKFKTEFAFEYDTENMKLLTNEEVKEQLSKQYFPTLDLGYYKSGKNRVYLNNLNDSEKKGKYWYHKDFFFWEVVCEPVYNESIETFGVPFYSTDNDDKNSDEYGRKVFNLIVDYPTSDYTVSLVINGIDIVSAPDNIKEIYNYINVDNSYKLTVDYATPIEWEVSAGRSYFPQSDTNTVYDNENKHISLVRRVYDLVSENNNSLISEVRDTLIAEETISPDTINNNGD